MTSWSVQKSTDIYPYPLLNYLLNDHLFSAMIYQTLGIQRKVRQSAFYKFMVQPSRDRQIHKSLPKQSDNYHKIMHRMLWEDVGENSVLLQAYEIIKRACTCSQNGRDLSTPMLSLRIARKANFKKIYAWNPFEDIRQLAGNQDWEPKIPKRRKSENCEPTTFSKQLFLLQANAGVHVKRQTKTMSIHC